MGSTGIIGDFIFGFPVDNFEGIEGLLTYLCKIGVHESDLKIPLPEAKVITISARKSENVGFCPFREQKWCAALLLADGILSYIDPSNQLF